MEQQDTTPTGAGSTSNTAQGIGGFTVQAGNIYGDVHHHGQSAPAVEVRKGRFRRNARTTLWLIVGALCFGGIMLWQAVASDSFVDAFPGSEPEPILSMVEYRLVPSSNPLTNDRDKIDLDTGCPGWGSSSAKVGRNRCGDLADLIAEDYGLHSPDDEPRLVPLAQGELASYNVCRGKFDSHGGVGVLRLADLRDGVELCVVTDKDNIAAVHVDAVTGDGELVVTYRLWKG